MYAESFSHRRNMISMRPLRPIFAAWFIVFALVAGAPLVTEAAERSIPQPASIEHLETLVQKLEDKDRREALVHDLRAMIASQNVSTDAKGAASPGATILADITERVAVASEQLVIATSVLFDLPVAINVLKEGITDPETRASWFSALGQLMFVFAVGIAVEILTRIALRRPHAAIELRTNEDFFLTIVLVLARTILDLASIAAFAGAVYGALTLIGPEQATRIAMIALVNAIVLARGVAVATRMLLAPQVAGLRIFPINDETANYLFVWVKRLANLTIYGYFAAHAVLLLGLPVPAGNVLMKMWGLAIGLLLIMLVLQNRTHVADWVRGDGTGTLPILRQRFAEIWHILMIIYLSTSYAVWALEIRGGFEFVLRATTFTVTIVVIGRLIELTFRRIVARAFALGKELSERLPGLDERANRYLPIIQSAVHGILYFIVVLAVFQVWGLDVFSWITSDTGLSVVGRVAIFFIIVSIAIVAWEIASVMIERYLDATDESGNAVTRSQRLKTLLPLLRNVLAVVLAVMVAMTILAELGLNIAPLLAGAGVVGLAVGFGAQTLVKDVITGVFILIENTISAGDVVEAGGHTGVVEAMTFRTIRLRDVSGTVHTVPFSAVSSIKNMTREFSFAVLDISVAYREDIDSVIAVIEEVGAELRADPEFEEKILEDIQVQGLDRFDDSAIVIRARIKTKPLQQWSVRRAFNLHMKRRFDELGIEIPFPHRTIYFGEDKEGKAPPLPIRLSRELR